MDVRDQIKSFFGDSGKTLLDESVYANEALRRDKIKLRKQRGRIEQEMDEYGTEYKELLRKGAQANELKRENYAKKAQIAKKKYKLKRKQYQKNSIVLGTVVSIEGARELQEMHDGDTTELESVIRERDVDVASVQEDMMNQMIEFDLDMEIMQEVQEGLDVDIMTAELQSEESEELSMMEDMAAGALEAEEIDLEDSVETEESVADVDLESELDEIDVSADSA